MTKCQHQNFEAYANVARLSHDDGGPVTGYSADIGIRCADCGVPFRFNGLPAGASHVEPRVSVDGTELRAPIEPATHDKFLPRAQYEFPRRGRKH